MHGEDDHDLDFAVLGSPQCIKVPLCQWQLMRTCGGQKFTVSF